MKHLDVSINEFGYWNFENGNRYSMSEFTEEEAFELSKTLMNCKDCVDCIECIGCTGCIECKYCLDCVDCVCCEWCLYCTKQRNCINCDGRGVCNVSDVDENISVSMEMMNILSSINKKLDVLVDTMTNRLT